MLQQLTIVAEQDLTAATPAGKTARRGAALHWRPETDDAPMRQFTCLETGAQRQQSSKAVADQMHRVGFRGQLIHACLQPIQDALLGGRHAQVVKAMHTKTVFYQPPMQHGQRETAHPQAVQQDHMIGHDANET